MVQDGAERSGIEGPKCDSLGGPRFSSSIVNVEGRWVFGIAVENVDGVVVLGRYSDMEKHHGWTTWRAYLREVACGVGSIERPEI